MCSSLKILAHLRTAPAAICLSFDGGLLAVLGGAVDIGVGDGEDGVVESRPTWQACGRSTGRLVVGSTARGLDMGLQRNVW